MSRTGQNQTLRGEGRAIARIAGQDPLLSDSLAQMLRSLTTLHDAEQFAPSAIADIGKDAG